MRLMKISTLFVCLSMLFFTVGCEEAKEVKEGADSVAAQATGLNQLEKKREMEDKIKSLNDANNKKIQDVLDEAKKD